MFVQGVSLFWVIAMLVMGIVALAAGIKGLRSPATTDWLENTMMLAVGLLFAGGSIHHIVTAIW